MPATPSATAALAARHTPRHFYRPGWDNLTLASVGLGTYLGEPDAHTDAGYISAARRYLQLGGNVLDTAINYRFQRSERNLGVALQDAIAAGDVTRAEVVVCTKGGYLSFDGAWPANPEAWIEKTFIKTGLVAPDEIIEGQCLAPAYLRHQIAQSRANLQVECLDLYYLHNPEALRAALGPERFREVLREAFATLEVAVTHGHIAAYGTATWNGYRAFASSPDYLALTEIIDIARDVLGDKHHFRAVQLPYNLAMAEAFTKKNQLAHGEYTTLLEAARANHLTVLASASLLQKRLLGRIPGDYRSHFIGCATDAQRAVQFTRSAPGLTTALVGMSHADHVDENLRLMAVEPMSAGQYQALFNH